jgi:hypothetical protein
MRDPAFVDRMHAWYILGEKHSSHRAVQAAVVTLQKAARTLLAKRHDEKVAAATAIQAVFRGYNVRKRTTGKLYAGAGLFSCLSGGSPFLESCRPRHSDVSVAKTAFSR